MDKRFTRKECIDRDTEIGDESDEESFDLDRIESNIDERGLTMDTNKRKEIGIFNARQQTAILKQERAIKEFE